MLEQVQMLPTDPLRDVGAVLEPPREDATMDLPRKEGTTEPVQDDTT